MISYFTGNGSSPVRRLPPFYAVLQRSAPLDGNRKDIAEDVWSNEIFDRCSSVATSRVCFGNLCHHSSSQVLLLIEG